MGQVRDRDPGLRRTGKHRLQRHFESTCYHPLLPLNREGDCLAAKLRLGNVHAAEDSEELLRWRSSGDRSSAKEWCSSADAAFAKPEIYDAPKERG